MFSTMWQLPLAYGRPRSGCVPCHRLLRPVATANRLIAFKIPQLGAIVLSVVCGGSEILLIFGFQPH
jgi:hypothetical protein